MSRSATTWFKSRRYKQFNYNRFFLFYNHLCLIISFRIKSENCQFRAVLNNGLIFFLCILKLLVLLFIISFKSFSDRHKSTQQLLSQLNLQCISFRQIYLSFMQKYYESNSKQKFKLGSDSLNTATFCHEFHAVRLFEFKTNTEQRSSQEKRHFPLRHGNNIYSQNIFGFSLFVY